MIYVRFLHRNRGVQWAGTPIAVFPFAVGIAFFIPLDLSFSCWFFYLFWKVERVFGDALGGAGHAKFPVHG